jgi:hypothetical protein
MKNIKHILVILLLLVAAVSCNESDDLITANATEGGLVTTPNTAFAYVVGSGASYSFDLFVYQTERVKTTEIQIYKSFFSNADTLWSNEVLQETITVTDGTPHYESTTPKDYAGLAEGLQVDGADLPTTDGELTIGDYFLYRVVVKTDAGDTFEQNYNVSFTVSTRYAGNYVVTAGMYYRLGVVSIADVWVGEQITIKSIDAITYQWVAWGEYSGWAGNSLFFQIDTDLNITYPIEWPTGTAQTLNGNPLTCLARNAGDLTNVAPYTTTPDVVVNDDVNGKDKMIMIYGYYTAGSGPREFYNEFVKVVD